MIVEDKVVFIAGGADSIGKAAAEKLSRAGARVFLGYRTDTQVDDVFEKVSVEGVPYEWKPGPSLDKAIDYVTDKAGRIDVLVNNFLSLDNGLKPFGEVTREDMGDIFSRTELVFELSRRIHKHMAKHKKGKIINLLFSPAFDLGAPLCSLYALFSGAMLGLSKGLVREIGKDGITINCISIGLLDEFVDNTSGVGRKMVTNLLSSQAFKRTIKAEDIAGSILYLVSENSDFLNGQVVIVNNGNATFNYL